MKNIQSYINESVFDDNRELSPFERAYSLKDFNYNTTDGTKDCLGQPLKIGDIILACDMTTPRIAVVSGSRGKFVRYWPADESLEDVPSYYHGNNDGPSCLCNKVVKIDLKVLKLK